MELSESGGYPIKPYAVDSASSYASQTRGYLGYGKSNPLLPHAV